VATCPLCGRIIIFFLAAVALWSLSGCGGSSTTGALQQSTAHRLAQARLREKAQSRRELKKLRQETKREVAKLERADRWRATHPHSKVATCGDLPVTTDRDNCRVAYEVCSVKATQVVQPDSGGGAFDTYATKYAHSVWGSSGFTWQAGYAGCMGALLAQYDRQHHAVTKKKAPPPTAASTPTGASSAVAAVQTFFTGTAAQTCSVLSNHYIQQNIAPAGCVQNYMKYTRNPERLRLRAHKQPNGSYRVDYTGHYPSGDLSGTFVVVHWTGSWLIWTLS
jgi:hypothetical protein